MNSKAQACTEYLFAIVLSFFLTLIVLGSTVGFAGTAKEDIACKISRCDSPPNKPERKKSNHSQ